LINGWHFASYSGDPIVTIIYFLVTSRHQPAIRQHFPALLYYLPDRFRHFMTGASVFYIMANQLKDRGFYGVIFCMSSFGFCLCFGF